MPNPWDHDPEVCGTMDCPGCYAAAYVPRASRSGVMPDRQGVELQRDNRPGWVKEVLGDEHFEGCHVNWQSNGECICDKIALNLEGGNG